MQLMPDLRHAEDLRVLNKDPLNLRLPFFVSLYGDRTARRTSLLGQMIIESGWSNRQNLANRLYHHDQRGDPQGTRSFFKRAVELSLSKICRRFAKNLFGPLELTDFAFQRLHRLSLLGGDLAALTRIDFDVLHSFV